MADTRVKKENYVTIQGWMVTDLKLKGNELILYAIIYGFSQAEEQRFTGSLQYLADWTNSTKQGVSKSLKKLIEKQFIEKTDIYNNGVKFCEYHTTKFNTLSNKVEKGMEQSLTGGMKQSLTNIIDLDTNKNNIDNIKYIIEYLNKKANTNYKPTTKQTQQHIKARLDEGFTIKDFETVIEKQCKKWIGTEWEQYLRPVTLFGTKFESYLNAKDIKKSEEQKPENPYEFLRNGVHTV